MHLEFRNVNDAFENITHGIQQGAIATRREDSRNGPVIVCDEPMLITYTHPTERVLFNSGRDCNPFFHLYEALWMLAGRNDVEPLKFYNSKIGSYSDDGKTFNGAYGYRWRNSPDPAEYVEYKNAGMGETIDQLDILVNHLKADPKSRRAVLQMWNVEDDLLKIGGDTESPGGQSFNHTSKDVCCNLSVMFSLRFFPLGDGSYYALDMTVTNRSNDLIWGMLGANYVHFSILQEYMAARIGVEVGKYHHFTNNLHAYEATWEPEKWGVKTRLDSSFRYLAKPLPTQSLVKNPHNFEIEVVQFVEHHSDVAGMRNWQEPFLKETAAPMMIAYAAYKQALKNQSIESWRFAFSNAEDIASPDWRYVAIQWLEKRKEAYDARTDNKQTADV